MLEYPVVNRISGFKEYGGMKLKRIGRIVGYVLIVLLAAGLIVPFLIPVPALENVYTPVQLADADSQFALIEGMQIHYKQFGLGSQNLILLHGFLANTFTWHNVTLPLAETNRVVVFDRPAFGLSARPLDWQDRSPYSPETQADIVIGLMDQLGMESAVLIGNSAGGTVAAFTALRYPERIDALVLVDAAIYTGGGSPEWIKPLLRLPQARRLGPLFVRTFFERQAQSEGLLELAWHDPSRIPAGSLAGYAVTFQVQDWDKALWAFTLSSRDLKLGDRLDELTLPVLVVTGDDDRIVPTEESIRLAGELPDAQLVVFPACGHTPQEECPQDFLRAVEGFLETVQTKQSAISVHGSD